MTRFWLLALLVFAVGAAASVGVALWRPQAYRSEAVLVDAPGAGPGRDARPPLYFTRAQLERVVDERGLYPEQRERAEAVEQLRRHLSVRARDDGTIGVAFEGEEPKRAQQVTAQLADLLVQASAANRDGRAAEGRAPTATRPDGERERAARERKEKEAALAAFVERHPELAQGARSEPNPSLLAEKQTAEAELQAAQKDLADKAAQFTDQHPDVRAARERVKVAEERLARAHAALGARPDGDEAAPEPTVARATLENERKKVNEELAAQKRKKPAASEPAGAETARVVALEGEWTRLEEELAAARAREREAPAAVSPSVAPTAQARLAILETAERPQHALAPTRGAVMGVGLGLSLLLAVLAAFAGVLTDDRLHDRTDVERLGLVRVVSVVPRAARRLPRGEKGAQRV